MNIHKVEKNGKLTITLEGRLDAITAPELRDVLIPALDETKEMKLDFTELAYISSAGLRVLLTGQKTAKENGASMTITGVSEEIMEVLDMTGFSDVLTIV